jgi:hypothetical protein
VNSRACTRAPARMLIQAQTNTIDKLSNALEQALVHAMFPHNVAQRYRRVTLNDSAQRWKSNLFTNIYNSICACYMCMWTSKLDLSSPTTLQNKCKTGAYRSQVVAKSWRDHPRTIQNLYRICTSNREGMAPYGRAWLTLATARFPCILQCFLDCTLW